MKRLLMRVLFLAMITGLLCVGVDQVISRIDAAPPTDGPKWTAESIRKIRRAATRTVEVPEAARMGWSQSSVDPAKLLPFFEPLKVKEGFRLHAFQFKDEVGNGNGFVWALPADATFPAPEDCPVLLTHFLQPPKPPEALNDFMEAIEGDDSLDSYLASSLLARELKEFGALWHGLDWTTHVVLDADPWTNPPLEVDEPLAMIDRPQSSVNEFTWLEDRPNDWVPRVKVTRNTIQVTFFTYSALEEQRIYRHVDYYQRGSYQFSTKQTVIAKAQGGFAF